MGRTPRCATAFSCSRSDRFCRQHVVVHEHALSSGAVVSRGDEERLSDCLSDEEYKELFIDMDTGDNDVEIKFKLIDWISAIL